MARAADICVCTITLLISVLLAAVLAAFELYDAADANIAVTPAEPLAPEQRDRVAAICSRIRFPKVPPGVLLNYWACSKWLQAYDPNKDLLRAVSAVWHRLWPWLLVQAFDLLFLKLVAELPLPPTALQITTAADPEQRALWQSSLPDPPYAGDVADAAAAQAAQAECLLWWTPRQPALVSDTDEATFHLQVTKVESRGSSKLAWCLGSSCWVLLTVNHHQSTSDMYCRLAGH